MHLSKRADTLSCAGSCRKEDISYSALSLSCARRFAANALDSGNGRIQSTALHVKLYFYLWLLPFVLEYLDFAVIAHLQLKR